MIALTVSLYLSLSLHPSMSLFLSPSLSPSLSFSLFLSLSLSFSLFHSPFPSLSLSLSLFLSTASFTASYIPYTPYTRWWRHRSGQILPRFPARYIFSVCVDDAMGFLVLFKLRFLTTPPYPTPPTSSSPSTHQWSDIYVSETEGFSVVLTSLTFGWLLNVMLLLWFPADSSAPSPQRVDPGGFERSCPSIKRLSPGLWEPWDVDPRLFSQSINRDGQCLIWRFISLRPAHLLSMPFIDRYHHASFSSASRRLRCSSSWTLLPLDWFLLPFLFVDLCNLLSHCFCSVQPLSAPLYVSLYVPLYVSLTDSLTLSLPRSISFSFSDFSWKRGRERGISRLGIRTTSIPPFDCITTSC